MSERVSLVFLQFQVQPGDVVGYYPGTGALGVSTEGSPFDYTVAGASTTVTSKHAVGTMTLSAHRLLLRAIASKPSFVNIFIQFFFQ